MFLSIHLHLVSFFYFSKVLEIHSFLHWSKTNYNYIVSCHWWLDIPSNGSTSSKLYKFLIYPINSKHKKLLKFKFKNSNMQEMAIFLKITNIPKIISDIKLYLAREWEQELRKNVKMVLFLIFISNTPSSIQSNISKDFFYQRYFLMKISWIFSLSREN